MHVSTGDVTIQDCHISSDSGYGLMLDRSAYAKVTGSTFRECYHGAVICGGSSKIKFVKNTVCQNLGFGILTMDQSSGEFIENSILF